MALHRSWLKKKHLKKEPNTIAPKYRVPFYVSERNCSEKETAQRVLPDAKRPLKTSELYETPQCSVISHVFQIAPWKMPDAQYSCGTERRCCTSQASLRAHAHVHSQQACSNNVLLALSFHSLVSRVLPVKGINIQCTATLCKWVNASRMAKGALSPTLACR